jgi:Flp pilus assembly pilin Flp
MKVLIRLLRRLVIWRDCRGQDMVEYALLAGFIAVAVGSISPGMANSMSEVYSRVASKLVEAGG